MKIKFFLIIVILLVSNIFISTGQPRILDRVVAIVGDYKILQSDIESMYLQYQAEKVSYEGDLKCVILEDYLAQNLLLNQAKIDSIEVSESQVEMQLDARLDYFINQIGSQERLEQYFKKTILEIKEDFRDMIRDQLITQEMRNTITADVTVTPSEVRQFFNKIPEDSVPFIDAKVELNQIVLYPPYSEEATLEVRQRLLDLRKRITDGENFATLAVLYSEHPTAPKGGEMGFMGKAEMDPDYAKAAFSLKKGQVSNIVQTAMGFHIIQLIERRDERVNTRHILVKPKVDLVGIQKTISRLDSIANLIRNDSMTFEMAARYFSQDIKTNVNGGQMVNPADNSTLFELDELQPAEYEVLRNMNVGEISQPFEAQDENAKTVYKIMKINKSTKPHKANIKEDYILLQQIALAAKNQDVLKDWIDEKIRTTYIHIDGSFKGCEFANPAWKQGAF
jgi:peptidyl-prolyl cis-trans isomerase SurA